MTELQTPETFAAGDSPFPPGEPDQAAAAPSPAPSPQGAPPGDGQPGDAPKPVPWTVFIRDAKDQQVRERFSKELGPILKNYDRTLQGYAILFLMEERDSIDGYDLDRLFNALNKSKKVGSLDVLLILLSRGGSIEPAYQISKICKSFARAKFVVAVPRYAKSAATLIALGADEIHMGPLAQLGPIDPQLGDLPALGVKQALRTIAELSEQFPGSADMFARYLRMALTVEQIGSAIVSANLRRNTRKGYSRTRPIFRGRRRISRIPWCMSTSIMGS